MATPIKAPKITSSDYDYQTLVDTAINERGEQLAGFIILPKMRLFRGISKAMPEAWSLINNLTSHTYGVSAQTENELADLVDYLHRTAGFIGYDQSGVYILHCLCFVLFSFGQLFYCRH